MTIRHARTTVTRAALSAVALSLPASSEAQVRGSERSQISQVADGTTITIDYARPHVRGRVPVFGGLVPWDHVWTPGANESTTFAADKDVTLGGVPIPAGRYSVWMVPAEGDWELVLDPNDQLYHTEKPSSRPEQIRFPVATEEVDFTEALTFDFPLVDATGMVLRFRWGTTGVPLRIAVEPTSVLTVDAEQARLLVGQYEMTFLGPPPPEAPPGVEMPPMQVDVRYDGEQLLGTIAGGPPSLPNEFALIPVAEFVFNPAWIMNGEVFETEVDMYFEFDVTDGPAPGFDVRGLEDRLMMKGQRSN